MCRAPPVAIGAGSGLQFRGVQFVSNGVDVVAGEELGFGEVHGGAGGEVVFVGGIAERGTQLLHGLRINLDRMSSRRTEEYRSGAGALEMVEGGGEGADRLGGGYDVAALVERLDGAVEKVEGIDGVTVEDLD
jgi:hypothetical protein